MTKQEEQDFIRLIKDGTLDALRSKEGKEAVINILNSEEGQDVLVKSFVEGYGEVVEPALEDISHDIKTMRIELKYIKDNHGARIERLERKAGLAA